jgi:hypothetical protein
MLGAVAVHLALHTVFCRPQEQFIGRGSVESLPQHHSMLSGTMPQCGAGAASSTSAAEPHICVHLVKEERASGQCCPGC